MQMKEIVIKVPEDLYDKGQLFHFFGAYSSILDDAIYNGQPLPKGHGRLIDADKYQAEINRIFRCNDSDDLNIRRATEIALNNAPTIIEADGGAE